MTEENIAYWFAASDILPRGDGRKIVLGETLTVPPPLVICESGLHWSRDPFDALRYAPGPMLYQVRPGGEIIEQTDKGCSTERTALAMRDATAMLRQFARDCALSVAHLWDAPDVVLRYLKTGDESLRAAAREVAGAAAWAEVARKAAWKAAWEAAWAAAWEAARAAWEAAWEARKAAWEAPWETAQRQKFNALVRDLFAAPQ